MKSLLTLALLFTLVFITWIIGIFHQGVFSTEGLNTSVETIDVGSLATWIPKSKLGVNQLILKGTPLERGYAAGRLTQKILYEQEKSLTDFFYRFMPNPLVRTLFIAGLSRWFSGIENYFEPWMLEEMYGVSLSTSHEFDHLADRFSRQVAYHGLHEVGQMMIDSKADIVGCTLFAIPYKNAWIIARNFDFEAGRIFDEEKIMKWVFPETGNAFVSVAWAGMVGVVTGVNEKGLYISLNAAGSDDSKRLGSPSTLVILKALQFGDTADEARKIIEEASMLITDVFVTTDRAGRLYRIEKSPKKVESTSIHEATVITNHLVGKIWASDKVNEKRKREGTTLIRFERGNILLQELEKGTTDFHRVALSLLRDKRDKNGKPYTLGDRRAIDSLIASHSVIYNATEELLYVSQAPGLTGKFIGFDLRKSFATGRPVPADTLGSDPDVTPDLFYKIRTHDIKTLLQIEKAGGAGGRAPDRAQVVYEHERETRLRGRSHSGEAKARRRQDPQEMKPQGFGTGSRTLHR